MRIQEEDVSLVEAEVKNEDKPSAEAEEDLENDTDDLKDEQEVGNVQEDKLIRLFYNLVSILAILVFPHSFIIHSNLFLYILIHSYSLLSILIHSYKSLFIPIHSNLSKSSFIIIHSHSSLFILIHPHSSLFILIHPHSF